MNRDVDFCHARERLMKWVVLTSIAMIVVVTIPFIHFMATDTYGNPPNCALEAEFRRCSKCTHTFPTVQELEQWGMCSSEPGIYHHSFLRQFTKCTNPTDVLTKRCRIRWTWHRK